MPKVSDEYKREMRNRILTAVEDACLDKPAYLLTMRDVIRAAGLSPGAVYSYYADIDALWLDYLNGRLSGASAEGVSDVLVERSSRAEGESAEDYLDRCFSFLMTMEKTLNPQKAKIYYELEIKRAADPGFAKKRREEAAIVRAYKRMLSDIAKAVVENSDLQEDMVYYFIKSCLEGLAKNVVEKRCYGLDVKNMDISAQINMLKETLRRMRNV